MASKLPLNIGIVTPTIAKSATGPSSWVATLCEHLCDAGHRVTVVTSDLLPGGDKGPTVQLDRRVEVKMFPEKSALGRQLHRSREMRQWLKDNVHRFDIIDIQGIWTFVAIDAARACLAAGVPYVITPHGMMARWDWEKRLRRKQLFYWLFLRSVWRAATAVRFLCEAERSHSVDSAVEQGVIIPLWVNSPITAVPTKAAQDALRADLHIEPAAPVIFFLGRISKQKGVVEIIRAFDDLWHRRRDSVLLLVGPIDPEYKDVLEEACRGVESRDHIHFTGPIYNETKATLFSLATVFITLSKSEGLPIAVLEALAAGLPVVTTEGANIPEVGQHQAGIIVPADDPAEVAERLDNLLKDASEVRAMGLNASRLIKEQFTPEVVFPRLVDMYYRACKVSEKSNANTSRDSASAGRLVPADTADRARLPNG